MISDKKIQIHRLNKYLCHIVDIAFICCILTACQKDDLNFQPVITAKLDNPVIFDAREGQVISFGNNQDKIDFIITDLINNRCPDNITCISGGSAILKLQLIEGADKDTITLYYPVSYYPDSGIINYSDSAYIRHSNEQYMIKLLQVRKVNIDKWGGKSKSVIEIVLKKN